MGSQAALREAHLQPPEVAGLRGTETGLLEPNLLDLRARSWEASFSNPWLLESPAVLGHPGDTQSLPSRSSLSPTARDWADRPRPLALPLALCWARGADYRKWNCSTLGIPEPVGWGRQATILLSPPRTLWKRGVGFLVLGSWLEHGVPTSEGPDTVSRSPCCGGQLPQNRCPSPARRVPRERPRAPCPGLGASLLSWYISHACPSASTLPVRGHWGFTRPGSLARNPTAPAGPSVPQVLLQPLKPVLVDQGRVEPRL